MLQVDVTTVFLFRKKFPRKFTSGCKWNVIFPRRKKSRSKSGEASRRQRAQTRYENINDVCSIFQGSYKRIKEEAGQRRKSARLEKREKKKTFERKSVSKALLNMQREAATAAREREKNKRILFPQRKSRSASNESSELYEERNGGYVSPGRTMI